MPFIVNASCAWFMDTMSYLSARFYIIPATSTRQLWNYKPHYPIQLCRQYCTFKSEEIIKEGTEHCDMYIKVNFSIASYCYADVERRIILDAKCISFNNIKGLYTCVSAI